MKHIRPYRFWRAAAEGLLGSLALALLTFICFRLHANSTTVALLYLVVIVLVSLKSSFVPSAFVSVIAYACLDYFFTVSGLSEWLDGESRLRILRAAPLPNLFVIPAGSPPVDPARVFYQLSESRLMAELQPRFANIVIDLPPVLDIAYGSLASKLAERIVLVARYGVTLVDDLEKVSFLLGRERLSGIMLNGTDYKTPGWLRRLL